MFVFDAALLYESPGGNQIDGLPQLDIVILDCFSREVDNLLDNTAWGPRYRAKSKYFASLDPSTLLLILALRHTFACSSIFDCRLNYECFR